MTYHVDSDEGRVRLTRELWNKDNIKINLKEKLLEGVHCFIRLQIRTRGGIKTGK
jgi:hypothetical protein